MGMAPLPCCSGFLRATIHYVQQSPKPMNQMESAFRLRALRGFMHRRSVACSVFVALLLFPSLAAQQTSISSTPADKTQAERDALLQRVLANQKTSEENFFLFERLERVETRKSASDPQPSSVKVSRVVPAGTGTAHLDLRPDGTPPDPAAYRKQLESLVKSLAWASETGRPQREAYEKVAKKRKERFDLIDATRSAFLFTFLGYEKRGDRTLSKYSLEPNPAFKPTSRSTSLFTKIRGLVWVDEDASELARVEVEITSDISLGLFLAKVYKGSHFMEERYEVAPGVWLPTYSQYDFDGRKFFSSFAVHERTFYSNYRRIGAPAEAIGVFRAELAKSATVADP